MAKSDRERLEDQLLEEYDIKHIMAAVCRMMAIESGKKSGTYTKEQIVDFFDGLDYDGLLELQDIAGDIELQVRQTRH